MRAGPGSIAVLGSLNMDVVLRVDRFPQPGETLMAKAVERHAGGKGLNQAIAAARAGASVALIGAMGEDADGEALLQVLRADGVECATVAILPEQRTGLAQILVDATGENQIVVASGANAHVRLPAGIAADVLLAQLETPLAEVAAILESRPADAIAILNAAPFCAGAQACFAAADVVILNETELAAYLGERRAPVPDDPIAAARALLTRPDQRVVVTLGKAGSLTVCAKSARAAAAGPVAEVVDTTGAGDCFCGYVAAGLAMGRTLEEAVTVAHRASAVSVGRPGAAGSIPYAAEL